MAQVPTASVVELQYTSLPHNILHNDTHRGCHLILMTFNTILRYSISRNWILMILGLKLIRSVFVFGRNRTSHPYSYPCEATLSLAGIGSQSSEFSLITLWLLHCTTYWSPMTLCCIAGGGGELQRGTQDPRQSDPLPWGTHLGPWGAFHAFTPSIPRTGQKWSFVSSWTAFASWLWAYSRGWLLDVQQHCDDCKTRSRTDSCATKGFRWLGVCSFREGG